MRRHTVSPTGREITLADEEIIVSKTDLRGVITYANDAFARASGFTRQALVGQPHNVIRHPDMPRAVFGLMWDALAGGREVFAYVVNQARSGDHYWVLAHVTPSRDREGTCVGYHSSRRAPYPDALPPVKALYAQMRAAEERHGDDPRAAIDAGARVLADRLRAEAMSYDEFIFSLSAHTRLDARVA